MIPWQSKTNRMPEAGDLGACETDPEIRFAQHEAVRGEALAQSRYGAEDHARDFGESTNPESKCAATRRFALRHRPRPRACRSESTSRTARSQRMSTVEARRREPAHDILRERRPVLDAMFAQVRWRR